MTFLHILDLLYYLYYVKYLYTITTWLSKGEYRLEKERLFQSDFMCRVRVAVSPYFQAGITNTIYNKI